MNLRPSIGVVADLTPLYGLGVATFSRYKGLAGFIQQPAKPFLFVLWGFLKALLGRGCIPTSLNSFFKRNNSKDRRIFYALFFVDSLDTLKVAEFLNYRKPVQSAPIFLHRLL